MPHPQKEPLRALTGAERAAVAAVARAGSERGDRVARATALLAVADGAPFGAAAGAAGRRSGGAAAKLVARFDNEGLAALTPGHGGGPPPVYDAAARERSLREVQRPPDRERDGTATWSLGPLRRALRRAPDGLPRVGTKTILHVLWDAGYTWQQSRTWGRTGTVIRQRTSGPVEVTDPDAPPKKS